MDFGEETRPENLGFQNFCPVLKAVQPKYKVGYADLIQYAHNHATVSCPRGPRIRKDATQAAPTGLLPDFKDSADTLIALFQAKGFSAHDLTALLGAHTSAKQRFVDQSQANKPLDTTPGVWEVEFYNGTLQTTPSDTFFVSQSDKILSVHPKMSDE